MGEHTRHEHILYADEEAEPEALLHGSSSFAGSGGKVKPSKWGGSGRPVVVGKRSVITIIVVVGLYLSLLDIFLLNSASSVEIITISQSQSMIIKETNLNESKLEGVLRRASMEDKTVIITTLNDAWIEPGAMLDVFLEGFQVGNGTKKMLNHLVFVTWDHKAYNRCLELHPHCYQMETKDDEEDYGSDELFMSTKYVHMMWRRTEFLNSVVQTGYSFVFTDLDILWLRNPFERLFKDVDFQIGCDYYNGDSSDTNNPANGGFFYVRSNNKTKDFYKLWIESKTIDPKLNEQDVFNKLKTHPFVSERNMTIRFLDTAYFVGFCQMTKEFDKVCTMHATCCISMVKKIADLKMVLDDWRRYMALNPDDRQNAHLSWSVPNICWK